MKRIFYFLLLVLVLSFVIPKGLSAAEEELYIPHSFTAYEKPSFTSKEVAQYSSTSVRIIDKQGSYWYKVYTSKGEKWVYYNPNLKNKTIDYRFNAFKGPSFNSTRVSSFSPTTVTVIGKHEDWYQIQTGSFGNVWVYDGRLKIPHRFAAYDTYSFTSTKVAEYSSTTLRVLDKEGSYWYQVITSKGNKWVYYNPNLEKTMSFDYKFYTYEQPSFGSKKVKSFDQDYVNVVAQDNNWYQIATGNYGLVWVYTGKLKVPHSFNTYEEASFTSEKVAEYSATTVRIIDKKGSYWYLIYTSKGSRWVYYNPNLKNLTIDYRFDTYEGPSFSSKRVSSFSPNTVNVIGKHGDWYLITTGNFGNVWVFYDGTGPGSDPTELKVPLEGSYTITSRYGIRVSGFHFGIDLVQDGTAKILASAAGTIKRANYSSSYGYVVYVYHSSLDLTTVYAHMRSNLQVSLGQTVRQGQLLGYMGNTGDSYGQHLHFEVHDGDWTYHGGLNPENYIDF